MVASFTENPEAICKKVGIPVPNDADLEASRSALLNSSTFSLMRPRVCEGYVATHQGASRIIE